MKNIIALCIFFGTAFMAFGQVAPSSINYQSILRNSNGSAVPNQNVSVRFSVLQGSTLGTYVFQEEHTVTTTDIGLINLKIGQGLSSLNSLSTIDWSQGPYFIQVEVDTTSTGSYSSYGSSEISSVPYALYSSSSAVTDSLSPLALNNLPKLTLSNDSLFIGSLDTIVIPFSQFNLTEIQVDSMVSNNGYLLTEKDSSVVNEIQELQLSGDSLTLSIIGTGVDLTKYLDDTKWSENQIDSLVGNNGFLTFEQDSSVTNEIQVLSRTGYKLLLSLSNDSVDMSDLIQDIHLSNDSLTITNNVNSSVVDLSPYLDNTVLSETEVDSYVSNNGYLTTEVDGSVTNEIQDLQLSSNDLTITNKTNPTTISLSPYLDNTVLSETEVDSYVSNNGYLTTEVDGSVTNEIQDLQHVLTQDNDADNQSIFNVKRQSIGQSTLDTSAVLDVNSTTQGFLPPRMTQAQRDAIYSPAAGLIVWCTDCGTNGLFSAYNGTGWSELQLTNTTGTVPTVNTYPVVSFGYSSATVGGEVLLSGGSSVLAKGLCYSKSPNPNITDFNTSTDTGNGAMSYFINNLDSNSIYYVRAYAQNANGIAYGSQQTFTTKTVLAVGDTFGGGIVAYLLDGDDVGYVNGEQHGIIISQFDYYGTAVPFGYCASNSYSGYPFIQSNPLIIDSTKTSNALLSGHRNTRAIMNACSYPYNIISLIDSYSVNGYSDWVVPSYHDLLYGVIPNRVKINLSLASNQQLSTSYWCSSVVGNTAKTVTLNITNASTTQSSTPLSSSATVRPVRYF